jgi:hypothetical protein
MNDLHTVGFTTASFGPNSKATGAVVFFKVYFGGTEFPYRMRFSL